MILQIFNKANS